MEAYCTVGEAAARGGVSEQRLRLLLAQGRIPGSRRWGRDWLVSLAGLTYWLEHDRDRRHRAAEPTTGAAADLTAMYRSPLDCLPTE